MKEGEDIPEQTMANVAPDATAAADPEEVRRRRAAAALADFSLVWGQLSDTRKELEETWRRQAILLAAGLAILIGLDVEALSAIGFTVENAAQQANARWIVRAVVALLGLFFFFRFGVLLSEFRYRRASAEAAAELYAGLAERPIDGTRLARTSSQFDSYLWPQMNWRVIGVLAYIVSLTAAMHAVNIRLAYESARIVFGCGWPDWGGADAWAFGLAFVYAIVTGLLYVAHLQSVRDEGETAEMQAFRLPKKTAALAGFALVATLLLLYGLVWIAPSGEALLAACGK